MRNESDPRKLEEYLERPEAYEGGLAPEIEGLADALQQWPQEAALQPRPGFLNELAQQLHGPEQATPPTPGRFAWLRLGSGLLRGAATAAAALVALLFFGLWLASLSSPDSAPATAGPAATPIPFVDGPGSGQAQGGAGANPGAALRLVAEGVLAYAGALFFLLLPAVAALWLLALWLRRRRAGKIAAVAGGLLLLLALAGYHSEEVSWRLLPALVNGYHYDPNVEAPDERLVWDRPEVLVGRQLDALLGQTGEPPLRADVPLDGYTIHEVRIDDWQGRPPRAHVAATLRFADGSTEAVSVYLPAGAGHSLLFPFLGAVNRAVFAWHAPESSLGHLFLAPAPGTPIRVDNPPLVLAPVAEVEAQGVDAPVAPESSFLAVSSLTAAGDLLADVDLREEERNVGNALLFHPAGGERHLLARTPLSARAAFSPGGRRVAYVRGPGRGGLELVVREAGGGERVLSRVDWMSHHWVGNEQIAFARDETLYLYNLRDGTEQALASLVASELIDAGFFRVAPDGRRVAYADLEGRLWVEEIGSGARHQIGWDVYEVGWGHGIAWRPDGQQLVYTALNNVTLPAQAEVWLWDAAGGEKQLLARSGREGYLGRFGSACWLDEGTVLFAAQPAMADAVRLLAARTDGSGLWDVTPPGVTIPFAETHCERGLVALNLTRTRVGVYGPAGAAGNSVVLSLADYPPAERPYRVRDGAFWLVHTPAGELFAFAPLAPAYREEIAVAECRYEWNPAVGRFVDPCSGDEWGLDGRLDLEHSTERWSRQDLNRYALSVEGERVAVHLDQPLPGGDRETDRLPHQLKGYELYSWQGADGRWHYTLVTGTNRQKTGAELMAAENQVAADGWVKITVAGGEALFALLGRLPAGEQVFWMNPEAVRESAFRLPSEDVVAAAAQEAERLGVRLTSVQSASE